MSQKITKAMQMILKVFYEDKIKRCQMPVDFEKMKEAIAKSFSSNIFFGMIKNDIYYMDDENDQILMENEYDFENAKLFLQQNNLKTLKITLKPNTTQETKHSPLNLSRASINKSINFSFLKESCQNPYFKCEKCYRIFSRKETHAKHTKICEKIFSCKRKPFDSKKQRSVKFILSNDSLIKPAVGTKIYGNTDFSSINIKVAKKAKKVLNKRKPFDSKKQRFITSEHFQKKKKSQVINKELGKITAKKWKKLSERFRTIMRISKMLYKKD